LSESYNLLILLGFIVYKKENYQYYLFPRGQPENGAKRRRGGLLAFHARGFNSQKGSPLPTIDSARIGAENRCLKIANAGGRRDGRRREENRTGTQLVHGLAARCSSLYLREVKEVSVRSIIGATEKRRESGAGVAVIGDIGCSGLVGPGGREFIRIEVGPGFGK
jgi:hypothetical protein